MSALVEQRLYEKHAECERLKAEKSELVVALRFYAAGCDATETTPCGYQGNLCCKTARAAIAKATEGQQ